MGELGCINGKTILIGLLASPIEHSLSPSMHNMSFEKLGINYVYIAFDVGKNQLADAVKGMRALNVRGFNVSMPNKTKILPLLDELSLTAKFAGAVNTVVNENGKLIGHNTDGTGYMSALKEVGIKVTGKKMTLLGAGGAATAIALQAALEELSEISIFNQKDEYFARAERNAQIIKKEMNEVDCKVNVYNLEDQERLKDEISNSEILANATGVGMKPLEGKSLIQDNSWLRPDLIVTDVVYIPFKTKLLEQAESVGCKTINGLGMMLSQGARAFEIWTGEKMPVELVKNNLFK